MTEDITHDASSGGTPESEKAPPPECGAWAGRHGGHPYWHNGTEHWCPGQAD